MASRFSLEAMLKMQDRLTAPMRKTTKHVNAFSTQMQRSFDRVNASANRASRATVRMRDITKGILGADLIRVGFQKSFSAMEKGIELASQLVEVQNVVDTTFKEQSKSINKWAKAATNSFGLSELQAKKFTGTLGAIIKSSGIGGGKLVEMSTRLTGLVGDFASFYDLPHMAAFDKIKSAITGETEPMKALGINMSVANMQAFALTQGIHKQWQKLTQTEQTLLRYQYLIAKSADAQGDFAKTASRSYAVQKRLLDVNIAQFLGNSFKKLLPFLIEGLKTVNRFISSIDVSKVADRIATAARGVVATLKALWPHIRRTWKLLTFVAPVLPVIAGGFIMMKTAVLGLQAVKLTTTLLSWIWYLWSMIPAMKASIAAQGLYNFLLKGTVLGSVLATAKTVALTAAVWAHGLALKGVAAITKIWTGIQWLLNAALAACPIILIVMAVIALIAGVYLLYKHWDLVIGKIKEAVNAVKEFFGFGGDKNVNVNTTQNGEVVAGGPEGAGYRSPQTARSESVTTNKSQVDVNFNNTPKGTTVERRGRTAPGTTLNLGVS